MTARVGIVVFPGSNCELDVRKAFHDLGAEPVMIWHAEHALPEVDLVVLPGGFAHGDYLRTGALARFSPVMAAVQEHAASGGLVVGICNGFQILCEAGMLPGALRKNNGLKFLCKWVTLRVDDASTAFTSRATAGQELRIPINHFEGNWYAEPEVLRSMRANHQIVLRYSDNPNGSLDDAAGICNESGNVFGLMPHPERVRGVAGLRRRDRSVRFAARPGGGQRDGVGVTLAPGLHRDLGLTDDELEAIKQRLGREPSHTELAMFSVMWSEHCSYKSSRVHLRDLPTEAPYVLVGPGEGAGIIEVAPGVSVAWKIESHNHPSFVEPFNGAATGVGGIVRDILSMGARPIALMDPLRFGPLDGGRTSYLVEGVVHGISNYGNSIGVPTVGGEVVFEECYAENPLVNVACLGVIEDKLMHGRAEGEGNAVILIGSATGRDGIGGASVLASAEFDDSSGDKRPSVQVGDPFTEKLLIEACLELVRSDLLVGFQDLGAGGVSCPTSEMASKAGTGMHLDIAQVHLREPDMEPFEIMISESQERMLAVVDPANVDEVLAVCHKWELQANVLGTVTKTGRGPGGSRRRRACRRSRRRPRRGGPSLQPRGGRARVVGRAPARPHRRRSPRRPAPGVPGSVGVACYRFEALGVGAVRPHDLLGHGAGPRR